MSRLDRSFFDRSTVEVAKNLIGKKLVYKNMSGLINEVEAYTQYEDQACHAYYGKTKRNFVMFGPPGFSYVYFIYGMYFCLNFVTEEKEKGCAVLIRSIIPVSGIDQMVKNRINWFKQRKKTIKDVPIKNLTDGPGKLCVSLGITNKQNSIDLCSAKDFYIEESQDNINIENIMTTPRIGIRKSIDLKYRFLLKDSIS